MDFAFRLEWLDEVKEEVIDPDRKIVDPHQHFFEGSEMFPSYSLEDYWEDLATHRVEESVFVECEEHYHETGPELMAPVGETEWVDAIAKRTEAGPEGAARVRAMVGGANLCRGEAVRELLEAHLEASSLFRGVRKSAVWDPDPALFSIEEAKDVNLYGEAGFREGFAQLAPLGLSYDAYHYHTQAEPFVSLARAFPDTVIVLDHLGTPAGVGSYAGRRKEIAEEWKVGISEAASCPNVYMKLGGLVMPWTGFGFEEAPKPPTSDEIVAVQGDYYRHAIESFGPERCMFESNFPVEKLTLSYHVLWNAFKKLAAEYSEDEQEALFSGTATRVYRLEAAT
ncbi:MAG: amidohydrolase family protein [Myxococcales bacterium]|nr:amidohydrolase family protein [Myxococcales bacterium]